MENIIKIIYVYDALCGWCYGFSEVIEKFEKKYADVAQFEIISGGMITGNRIGAIGDVASYISTAYKDVERATAIKFGKSFLDGTLKNGVAIFSSIPASIALSVFKSKNPKESFQFANAIQKAIYYDGIEPTDVKAFAAIAEKFGCSKIEFEIDMNNTLFLTEAQKDFDQAIQLQVGGFPCVIVEYKNTYYKIATGYVNLETLEKNFLTLKNTLK